MDSEAKKFLLELLNTPSPSGFEAPGQRLWMQEIQRYSDGVESDAYGNAWARRTGTRGEGSPTVLLEAHADEIGFMVNHITDDGFLHINRIGGSDRSIARDKKVQILGSKGPVAGVIGNTAIHLRDSKNDKVPEVHELFVDIGASSRSEVEARGIRVGHPLVYSEGAAELLGGKLTGRALDNRIGGFILTQVFSLLKRRKPLPVTVYAANCVQEEIGGYGARMIAYRLKPDSALILDVTHATDSPGIDKAKYGDIRLGAGPSISHGKANHPALVERLESIAKAKEIAIQHEATSAYTGTDTDDIFISREGVPCALVSLPLRYMHSTIETVDLKDLEQCIELLTAFVESLDGSEKFRVVI